MDITLFAGGQGEFDPEHYSSPSRDYAQRRFLKALREECYEVLEDLKSEVLPAEDREQSLQEWAERWNLSFPWLLEVARTTLEAWDDWELYEKRREGFNRSRRRYAELRAEKPELHPELGWRRTTEVWSDNLEGLLQAGIPHVGDEFTFEFRPFNPFHEKASDYRSRIEKKFRETLRQHIEDQRGMAANEGDPAVSVELGGKTEPAQRFRWLARRIVYRETWEALAEGTPVTYQTIQKHCRKLAELVGVDLPE